MNKQERVSTLLEMLDDYTKYINSNRFTPAETTCFKVEKQKCIAELFELGYHLEEKV